MSILEGISGILGTFRIPDPEREQILDEINFMEAISAHVRWKARLQDYLNGTLEDDLDPEVVCRDEQCLLGKWIHGPGYEHFQHEPKFYQLRTDHAQFHFIAGNVIRHVQANERAQAEALMDNEYKHASRKVVQALTELNAQLNG
jgi:hypothetical protein